MKEINNNKGYNKILEIKIQERQKVTKQKMKFGFLMVVYQQYNKLKIEIDYLVKKRDVQNM